MTARSSLSTFTYLSSTSVNGFAGESDWFAFCMSAAPRPFIEASTWRLVSSFVWKYKRVTVLLTESLMSLRAFWCAGYQLSRFSSFNRSLSGAVGVLGSHVICLT